MAIYIFYDSFSKMYLIYSTLCYIIIILHFAAIEALSPLPRDLGNDGSSRGRKVVIRDKDRQLRGSYHVESNKDQSIELIVDDLVEKVKNRLKSELKMITASPGSLAKSQTEEEMNPREEIAAERKRKLQAAKLLQDKYIKPTYLSINELEGRYQPTEDPTAQNNRPKIGIPKIKVKSTTPDKRYLAEVFTAKPPKYLLEYGPPKLLKNPTTADINVEIKRTKKTYTTEDVEPETESTPLTTEDTGSFVGFDLMNGNDSYEDYVTPKKDLDYKEPESQTSGYGIVNKDMQNQFKSRQKIPNDFEKEHHVMVKTKNRVDLDDDKVIYEQKMLGDFDRANNPVLEYEKTGDIINNKKKQKDLDDFYRAKQLMSKIKHLNNAGDENKNIDKFKHEAVRDFDKLKAKNLKEIIYSNRIKPTLYKINDDRAKELRDSQMTNIDIGMKPYHEQLKYLELNENANNIKATIQNQDDEDSDIAKGQIENKGIEMAAPILRARKHVDALVKETQPEILKRRKSFDTFIETDLNTNETSDDDDDDDEATSLNKLLERILGNVPKRKTKIYLINLA